MLDKKICKRCIQKRYTWGGDDEYRWRNGRVLCDLQPFNINNCARNNYDSPPETCPHILEHALAGGVNAVE